MIWTTVALAAALATLATTHARQPGAQACDLVIWTTVALAAAAGAIFIAALRQQRGPAGRMALSLGPVEHVGATVDWHPAAEIGRPDFHLHGVAASGQLDIDAQLILADFDALLRQD